ncbi:MAG: heme lyase CcmF/NrfE family subunit [Anaerolineaceae bacterium]|nr:heme lyase CcmF/NrfE family subunit [Anaerolineaceae bacterium]
MIGPIGYGSLVIALVISLLGVVASIYGQRIHSNAMLETARRAALVTFPLLSLSIAALLVLLVSGHFEYTYVYQTTDLSMPFYLKLAALWGGQEGSLLFWCWLLSSFMFLTLMRKWKSDHDLLPWVIAITSFILFFFLILVLFFENPFNRYFITMDGDVVSSLFPPMMSLQANPTDGNGLSPLLRHFGMIVHPPALYLGFTGFVIPYAYAMAALINGRTDDRWLKSTRRSALFAWMFLSIGLVLGSRWAYDVLGWGGYWGWDPVEISALIPWLTGTAYLHSMVTQEKRGMFKHWNVALIILTFCLVIFGTFLTRSGLLSSVHSFSESEIGPAFLAFIAVMFLASLGLLLWRWSDLSSPYQIPSLFSREAAFLINNLLFIAIFLICLTGILFPILSELLTGQKVTVGPPFYEHATGPLFALLLLLMGIVPLTIWGSTTARSLGKGLWKPALLALLAPLLSFILGGNRWTALLSVWLIAFVILATLMDTIRSVKMRSRTHQESGWKAFSLLVQHNRRRYGGYLIHIGVALMGLGIIGIEFFQTTTQGMIAAGESLTLSNYTFTYEKLDIADTPDGRNSAVATVLIRRDGRELGRVYPGSDYYYASQQSVTRPGIRSTLGNDLYIILVDWLEITTDGATFKIYYNPLINWLWIGSFVLIIGTLVALWPARNRRKAFSLEGSA